MLSWKRIVGVVGLCLLISFAPGAMVQASQSSSSNYSVSEVFFGTGGELNACSTSYCSKQSTGETAVGNTASPNYQAQAGFNTNREEYLEFYVPLASIDLGTLTTSSTRTGSTTFSIKSYLSSGYQVVTISDPPSNGSSILTGISAPSASIVGSEQFGINLVANTSPVTLGANPVHVPSAAFSYGMAAAGYDTPNQYKYVKGEVVANSTKSSGQTDYTISYIANISNSTRAGMYAMSHVLVATATF